MESKLNTSERLDHLDAERFRDMLASPSFLTLTARIEAELERKRELCERLDKIGLYRAQGSVAALRTVLALPAQILKEIESHRK
jgi:hypothetical protein